MEEKQFEKYKTRGADYHWKEMNVWNPLRYNAYLAARYQKISDKVRALIKNNIPKKSYSIVDFGCGDGVQLDIICRSNRMLDFNVSGIDLSSEALAVAKRHHPSGTFYESSVYESPLLENSFDIAISCDVIEHVQDANRMISEMVRVTKMGGHIIIGTPIKYTERPLDSMHVIEYFFDEFSSLFSERPGTKIVGHTRSHPLSKTLLYSDITQWFGIRIPIMRYMINLFILITGRSPFLIYRKNQQPLMTYQFIVLCKQ